MRSTRQSDPAAVRLVDEMILMHFGPRYGVTNTTEYWQHVHDSSTVHLTRDFAQRRKRTTGAQQESIVFTLEDNRPLAHVPMNDKRKGEVVYAILWADTLFNLIECGADGAWFLAYKGPKQSSPQVRTMVPFAGCGGPTNATIARLIRGARRGQQASIIDHNPLNLRTENVRLVKLDQRKGRAKADSRGVMRNAVDARKDTSKRKRGQQ